MTPSPTSFSHLNENMFTVILVNLLLLITLLPASGEVLSLCAQQSDCESPLICSPSLLTTTCPPSTACRCHPAPPSMRQRNNLSPCENDTDCPPNHSCFENPDKTSLVCIAVSGDSEGVSVGVGETTGVTFDVCRRHEDCLGGRRCRLIQNLDVTDCEGRQSCTCLSAEPVVCSSDEECDEGEMCAETTTFGRICVSRRRVQNGGVDAIGGETGDEPIDDDLEVDESEVDDPDVDDPVPDTEPPTNGTALVLEPCKTSSDCLPPRQCLDIVNEPDTICPEAATNECVCGYLEIPACMGDKDCAEGESCSPRQDGEQDFCVSKAVLAASGGGAEGAEGGNSTGVAVPSPDGQSTGGDDSSVGGGDDAATSTEPGTTDDGNTEGSDTTTVGDETPSESPLSEGVCVDAELLSHLPASQLVFPTPRLARVLCDGYGSCGTRGHMVRWGGRAMLMKSYCDEVGCEELVKRVNSPRYRRGGWVDSRSEGLVFMTLAARYGSRAEELVLRAVVGVGL